MWPCVACIDSQSKVSCFCLSLVLSKMRVQDSPNAHWLNKIKISLLKYIVVASELTVSMVHLKNQLQWKLKCTLCSAPLHQVHLLDIRESQENKQEKCFRPLCRKIRSAISLSFSLLIRLFCSRCDVEPTCRKAILFLRDEVIWIEETIRNGKVSNDIEYQIKHRLPHLLPALSSAPAEVKWHCETLKYTHPLSPTSSAVGTGCCTSGWHVNAPQHAQAQG